jgi:hypothetical protein
MGRAATSQRTTHRGAGVVDRSTGGVLCPDQGPGGTPPLGPSRTDPLLSAPQPAPQEAHLLEAATPQEAATPRQEVTLHHLWFQLPVPDRQRFGHCFSAMLLKALGLRPAPTQEVNS